MLADAAVARSERGGEEESALRTATTTSPITFATNTMEKSRRYTLMKVCLACRNTLCFCFGGRIAVPSSSLGLTSNKSCEGSLDISMLSVLLIELCAECCGFAIASISTTEAPRAKMPAQAEAFEGRAWLEDFFASAGSWPLQLITKANNPKSYCTIRYA